MTSDFIIAGAGAVGLTSALTLLEAGYRVTLVERGEVGREASWAGGGIMSPLCSWDYREEVTQLAHRGMKMLGDAAEMLHATTGIDPEYQRSGMLVLPPCRSDLAEAWCAQHQFPLQRVAIDQYLRQAMAGEALLLPDVAQVRNPRFLRALRRRVEMSGGQFVEQCEVHRIEVAADRVVGLHSTQGKLTAANYLITAGAWSKPLLGEFAPTVDLRPIRGQILLFKFDTPPFTQILLKESLYFIPRRDGHVLVGSTLEDVGFDKSTTAVAREQLMQDVREVFPYWDVEPIQHWAGFRPGSPDNVPIIGRHPSIANLYANTGHFRYGVTMSLAAAEILLNEIEGEAQPFDTTTYLWR